MNIVKRLFTYPVLKDEVDAYENYTFSVSLDKCSIVVNDLEMTFLIDMECPEIEDLIQTGKAEYAIHVECSSTAYRTLVTSAVKKIDYSIPVNKINGTIELVGLVLVKTPIKGFTCVDWSEDYQGLKFDFEKGNILAYQNMNTLNIRKNVEEFKDASSIFSVCKRASKTEKPMELELNNDTIRIEMDEKDYKVFTSFSGRTNYQQVVNSMLILPALVYVFEELRQDDGIQKYENRGWYIALANSYAERNINLEVMLQEENKTSYYLAQEAMELPITKAFSLLPLLDRQNDYDEED